MTFAGLLPHSVTIYPFVAGSADRYGDAADGFGTGVVTTGRLSVLEVDELEVDRDTRTARAKLILRPNETISALSEVVFDGGRWRVIGEPVVAYAGSAAHHIVADLLKVDA